VGDIDMYYELHGEGPPLVLIGGLASQISETEWLTRAMARTHRVLAFDNRGAGRTDKPDEPYSIPMMAADTDGLMGTLGIREASVLGVSMGGRIALELALSHPDRVSQLILVSTMAAARTPETSTRLGLLTMFAGELFQGRHPQPFRRQRQASAEYDCTDRVDRIHVPTTILHGRHDRVVRLRMAEEMHAGIEGSRMITFHGGHMFFMFRERKWFLDTVDDALRRR